MFKQIFIKELLKLKPLLLALATAHLGLAVYYIIRLRFPFANNKPVLVWFDIVLKDAFFFSRFEIPLMATAGALALAQFYPEVEKKRFRISCHLPMEETKMILSLALFGISALLSFWLFDTAAAYAAGAYYFPREISSKIPVVMSYWLFNSLIIYTIVAVLTLEPSKLKKVKIAALLLPFIGLIDVSFYNARTIYLCLLACLSLLFTLALIHPALRFRQGV